MCGQKFLDQKEQDNGDHEHVALCQRNCYNLWFLYQGTISHVDKKKKSLTSIRAASLPLYSL